MSTPLARADSPQIEASSRVWRRVGRIRLGFTVGVIGLLAAALAVGPLLGGSLSFYYTLALWITLATGLNIIAGFTGYMPLGYVAFFGVGSYATAILAGKAGWPIALALPMSGVAALLLSLLFARTLKLTGVYFAIVSLALAIICQLFIAHLPDRITGGSFGIMLGRGSQPLASFYAMLVLMTGSLLFVTWLAVSRLGKALRAIRDDPEAAGVLGVNVARTRLKAWVASATVAGFVGGVDVWYTNIVDPESGFEFLITAKTIIYAIAGGLGTVLGPVVGALVMVSIDDAIWQRFPLLNMMILGLAIILLMLFLPRGIVGTAVQRWPLLRRYLM